MFQISQRGKQKVWQKRGPRYKSSWVKADLLMGSVINDLRLGGRSQGPEMEISSISQGAKEAEWRNTLYPGTRVPKWPVHIPKVIPEMFLQGAVIHTSSRNYFSSVVSMSLSFNQVNSVKEQEQECSSSVSQEAWGDLNYPSTTMLCSVSQGFGFVCFVLIFYFNFLHWLHQ